jgi:hypothetical protein
MTLCEVPQVFQAQQGGPVDSEGTSQIAAAGLSVGDKPSVQ